MVLWYVSGLFNQTFSELDSAGGASFRAVELGAIEMQQTFQK